jgi:hypothetical protein
MEFLTDECEEFFFSLAPGAYLALHQRPARSERAPILCKAQVLLT